MYTLGGLDANRGHVWFAIFDNLNGLDMRVSKCSIVLKCSIVSKYITSCFF